MPKSFSPQSNSWTSRAAPALLLGLALTATRVDGQTSDALERQVTVFAVIATPDDLKVDPKLEKVLPQLRKLFPKHGFRLLDVKSKRLASGQAVGCSLESGYTAETELTLPADENGKVQLRCTMFQKQTVVLESLVTTPPNQLFFCDKKLDDGRRLLIGVGAR